MRHSPPPLSFFALFSFCCRRHYATTAPLQPPPLHCHFIFIDFASADDAICREECASTPCHRCASTAPRCSHAGCCRYFASRRRRRSMPPMSYARLAELLLLRAAAIFHFACHASFLRRGYCCRLRRRQIFHCRRRCDICFFCFSFFRHY